MYSILLICRFNNHSKIRTCLQGVWIICSESMLIPETTPLLCKHSSLVNSLFDHFPQEYTPILLACSFQVQSFFFSFPKTWIGFYSFLPFILYGFSKIFILCGVDLYFMGKLPISIKMRINASRGPRHWDSYRELRCFPTIYTTGLGFLSALRIVILKEQQGSKWRIRNYVSSLLRCRGSFGLGRASYNGPTTTENESSEVPLQASVGKLHHPHK